MCSRASNIAFVRRRRGGLMLHVASTCAAEGTRTTRTKDSQVSGTVYQWGQTTVTQYRRTILVDTRTVSCDSAVQSCASSCLAQYRTAHTASIGASALHRLRAWFFRVRALASSFSAFAHKTYRIDYFLVGSRPKTPPRHRFVRRSR